MLLLLVALSGSPFPSQECSEHHRPNWSHYTTLVFHPSWEHLASVMTTANPTTVNKSWETPSNPLKEEAMTFTVNRRGRRVCRLVEIQENSQAKQKTAHMLTAITVGSQNSRAHAERATRCTAGMDVRLAQ